MTRPPRLLPAGRAAPPLAVLLGGPYHGTVVLDTACGIIELAKLPPPGRYVDYRGFEPELVQHHQYCETGRLGWCGLWELRFVR